MSDLRIYELEENVWDEFSETDDHIVPHEADKRKKPRREVIGVASDGDHSIAFNIERKEETSIPNLTNKDTMVEKGSWSQASDGVLPDACDAGTGKEVVSEETGTSSNPLKSDNSNSTDPVLGEKCAMVDNDTYNFPLSNISQEDNDLSFLDNVGNNKPSSDLLYYEWPEDLGNFVDVDRMFRSCDESFGLGSLGNEDDFSWFSSCETMEGNENASMWGSKLSGSGANVLENASQHNEDSNLKGPGSTADDLVARNQIVSNKTCSKGAAAANYSSNGHLLYPNGSDSKPVVLQKRQVKQNPSEGKRREKNLENGGSSYNSNGLKQIRDTRNSLGDPLQQALFVPGTQQPKQNMGSNSLAYMQNLIPCMHYGHSLDQSSVFSCHSGRQSENNSYRSAKESSFASNQVQSLESSHTPFDAPVAATNNQRGNLFHVQDWQASVAKSLNASSIASSKALYDSVAAQKETDQSETEGHCEIGDSIGVPADVDSSNAVQSSCMSSMLDDISLEATSFRQLQQVMEQLDIRTKLCIRDSLYRLARSAEQRHNCVNSNGSYRDDSNSGELLVLEETNKRTGFMDMEADTNPIDRSIAHLLFHRPSDPSITNMNDATSVKSHAMIHSPSAVIEEQVCQGESAVASDTSLLVNDDRR